MKILLEMDFREGISEKLNQMLELALCANFKFIGGTTEIDKSVPTALSRYQFIKLPLQI